MVLSRFSKKGQQTEGAEKGNETSSYCINTWRCGIHKHQKKGKENKQNPYRPDAALEKDPPKKEIDRKRIPFVWSEGGAALTEKWLDVDVDLERGRNGIAKS
jgi:hypothetical protein